MVRAGRQGGLPGKGVGIPGWLRQGNKVGWHVREGRKGVSRGCADPSWATLPSPADPALPPLGSAELALTLRSVLLEQESVPTSSGWGQTPPTCLFSASLGLDSVVPKGPPAGLTPQMG